MTLDEARDLIGQRVVYDGTEHGRITSVNARFVFVRFGQDQHSKAVDPDDLHPDCPRCDGQLRICTAEHTDGKRYAHCTRCLHNVELSS